jgi:hypothetical protein
MKKVKQMAALTIVTLLTMNGLQVDSNERTIGSLDSKILRVCRIIML